MFFRIELLVTSKAVRCGLKVCSGNKMQCALAENAARLPNTEYQEMKNDSWPLPERICCKDVVPWVSPTLCANAAHSNCCLYEYVFFGCKLAMIHHGRRQGRSRAVAYWQLVEIEIPWVHSSQDGNRVYQTTFDTPKNWERHFFLRGWNFILLAKRRKFGTGGCSRYI